MKRTPTHYCTHWARDNNGACCEITMATQFLLMTWWLVHEMPRSAPVLCAVVHQQEREAPFGWSWWKGLTQRMNIWRSWVVTWEIHLPTAFLLVYWWRDDTEELGSTLYKASLSAASHSFKDHCCWNFSIRDRTHWKPARNREVTVHHERGRTILCFKTKGASELTQLRTIRALRRRGKHQ